LYVQADFVLLLTWFSALANYRLKQEGEPGEKIAVSCN